MRARRRVRLPALDLHADLNALFVRCGYRGCVSLPPRLPVRSAAPFRSCACAVRWTIARLRVVRGLSSGISGVIPYWARVIYVWLVGLGLSRVCRFVVW